jgi:catechol 2,3-dioxygenase-like lactoylglutathione lyase family enzyme
MIVPNLRVSDMARAVAFWRDALGFELTLTVDADRNVGQGAEADPGRAVFATLEWNGHQLMLQTARSLAAELPGFAPGEAPPPSGTLYLRGHAPDAALPRLPEGSVVKGPETSWYGMRELYVRDPDGHLVCLGAPEGPPPG